jgi:hypothetical protein
MAELKQSFRIVVGCCGYDYGYHNHITYCTHFSLLRSRGNCCSTVRRLELHLFLCSMFIQLRLSFLGLPLIPQPLPSLPGLS